MKGGDQMNTRRTKTESMWSFLIGFLALLVFGFVFVQVVSMVNPTNPRSPVQTELSETTATTTVVDIEATYDAYRTGGENPPPTAPKDPTLAPAPPTVEALPFPTGVFSGGGDAFYSGDVTIVNY